MFLYTSNRERRLWLSALAVTVAIWSTLGLAGTLAEKLRERSLLDLAFAVGFLFTIAAVVAGALQRVPKGREIWIGLGVATAYGMVVVRMGVSLEERSHLFEYGLLAVLIHQALSERRRNGGHVRAPAILAIVVTSLLGWIDEGIQAVLPGRVYDLRDVGINALAAVMAVGASLALSRIRCWRVR